MNWTQMENNSSRDIKLVRLFSRYRHEGRDLYWEVVRRISEKLTGTNICFSLEETSADLSRDPLIDLPVDKVDAILNYCVELGLFDREPGTNRIRCLKVLSRLNNDLTRNPQIREMIRQAKLFNRNDEQRRDNVVTTSTNQSTNQETNQPAGKLPRTAGELWDHHRAIREKAV